MLSLFLIGCFQIDGEKWETWEGEHTVQNNTQDALPSFTVDAEISPSVEVYTDIPLTCTAVAIDFNEAELTPAYIWKVGDDEIGEGDSFTPTRENSDVDDVITCIASVTDSNEKTETSETTVTLKNTDPAVTEPEIDHNEQVYNDDVLSCSATASDIDEDVTVSYSWEQGGVPFTEGSSVNLDDFTIEPNQTISCVASVEDSNEGSDSKSTSVIIENRNPNIANIALSNALPEIGDTIICSATSDDDDGDDVTLSFSWEFEGLVIDNDDTITLAAETFSVGNTLSCLIRAVDDFDGITNETSVITVQNTLPTIGATTISPSTGVNSISLLSCSAEGFDVNDGVLTPAYEWINGTTFAPIGTDATLQLGTHLASPNDTITCTATVTDAEGATAASSDSVLVNNAPPEFTSPAEVYPNTGIYTGTNLGCLGSATDPEDGSAFLTYSWTLNGNQIGTNQSYTIDASETDVGDTLICTITAMDGTGAMTDSFASVIIENSAPTMDGINLTTAFPEADDQVTSFPSASDADGDNLSYTYSWMFGSTLLGNSSSQNFDPSYIGPGDMVDLTIMVSDGNGGSDSMTASVQIANSPPEIITEASISPDPANTGSLVVCTAEGEDLNDGPITPTYEWTNVTTSSNIGSGNMLQLDASKVLPNDNLRCTATVTDSEGEEDSSIAVVTIENAAPSFTQAAQISPNIGIYSGVELTCTAVVEDPEQGTMSPNYFWKVNGVQVDTGTTFMIEASQTTVGDSISCTAEAIDSSGLSATSIATVDLENSAPFIHNIALIPATSALYNDSTVSCGVAAIEADEESLSYSYVWSSDGVELGYSYAFDLSTTALMPGDTLVCTAEVSDPHGDFGQDSASMVIENRAPEEPIVLLEDSSGTSLTIPESSDDLVCVATGAVEPDGEAVTYTYSWSSSFGANISGDTVLSSETSEGELWTCEVVVSDGIASTAVISQIVIATSCNNMTCADLDIGGGETINFVLIEGGSDYQGNYTITNDYYTMTTEVTQGMYEQLMGSSPASNYGAGANYPVYSVSWHMAADFANQVTQVHNSFYGTSLSECYSCSGTGSNTSCTEALNPYQCSGYRLPTEVEWDYASRSGSQYLIWTPAGGGDYSAGSLNDCYGTETILDGSANPPLLGDYAWYCGNNDVGSYSDGTKEVATRAPNGWGLYDMFGNVAEWTADWGGCASLIGTDFYCQSDSATRMQRGGHWDGAGYYMSRHAHFDMDLTDGSNTLGFRLVLGQ